MQRSRLFAFHGSGDANDAIMRHDRQQTSKDVVDGQTEASWKSHNGDAALLDISWTRCWTSTTSRRSKMRFSMRENESKESVRAVMVAKRPELQSELSLWYSRYLMTPRLST